MSDCTPDETDLLDCYAGLAEKFDGLSYDEGYEVAERTLADIKACAWAQGLAAAQSRTRARLLAQSKEQSMSSDYTPGTEWTKDDIRLAFAEAFTLHTMEEPHLSQAYEVFDRFIAKVKADALREAARSIQGTAVGSCNTGCHVSDMMTLQMLADRIEGEA